MDTGEYSGEQRVPETTLDELLAVLADGQRRRVLGNLFDGGADGQLTLDGLDESDSVMLVHVHLPKLTASGLVEWDDQLRLVRRGPTFERVEPLLSLLDGSGDQFFQSWR